MRQSRGFRDVCQSSRSVLNHHGPLGSGAEYRPPSHTKRAPRDERLLTLVASADLGSQIKIVFPERRDGPW